MPKLFNKSSKEMKEIKSDSIDLIITSPPFNIGTEYLDFKDNISHEEYIKTLSKIFNECFRTLKKEGVMIIEIADTVLSNGKYISLSALIQSICKEANFSLTQRHINFTNTKDGEESPDNGWDKDYTTTKNSHSNCNHFLVFSKTKTTFNPNGKIFYSTYLPSTSHPCPFPKAHVKILLDLYFTKEMIVLDPFMGSGILGTEVIGRGGDFYGYELIKEFYDIAVKNMGSK